MSERLRNSLILGLVALLVIASGAIVASKKTRLGLDLKGGVELVYQAEPSKQSGVTPDALNRAIEIMRARVDQLGVAESAIQTSGGNQIDVSLPDVQNAQRAIDEVGQVAQMFFYDWEPNVIGPNGKPAPGDATVTGGPNAGQSQSPPALSQYDAVIRALKRPAIPRPNATTNGTWYALADKSRTVLDGPEESRANVVAALAQKRIPLRGGRIVEVQPGTIVVQAEQPSSSAAQTPATYYVLNDNPVLRGSDIKNPQQSFDNSAGGTGQPIVTFDFSSSGRAIFQKVTRQIAQRGAAAQLPGTPASQSFQHFAVVLDNKLITVPFIDFTQNPDGIDATNGSQIQGGFTIDSAQRLANLLQSGALPIKLKLISQSQVSATLGKQALNQGLIAGLVGFAVVALFLLTFYRVLGLIAVAALFVYALYFFALIKLIPITLTLPGIAGLILTIGVAADANIVIFERVKEEIRAGRSIAGGIAAGYKRGIAAIIDANVVTFMTAFVIFVLATAGVKGFALVLGIGTLVSLFTAVLATQAILTSMGRSRLISRPSALGAGERRLRWNVDFMGASKWFFSLSGTILLIGALSIGGNGLKLGIDFEGGTQIKTGLVRPASESTVRSVLGPLGYSDAQIQRTSDKTLGPNGFQIKTRTLQPDKVQRVRAALDARFANARGQPGVINFTYTSIGPDFGKTIANKAVIAIIVSLIVISLYIALRFEWKYAVPVLIALMHDVLITAGVYSLTGREVTSATVAALLTILGYSLYDTIIVFDRVRENVPRMPRAAFSQIVNRSMSEVLTRSLATSFCTLLPIIALLLFGGATLKDFAFALMVGVASGAYSSIFIASPVLTHWKERETVYANRRARIERDSGGVVPAFALATTGVPVDVEPAPKRRRRPGRVTAPEQPEEGISKDEFDELVRDLDVDAERAAPAGRSPADDLEPEDVVMPRAPRRPAPGRRGTGGRGSAGAGRGASSSSSTSTGGGQRQPDAGRDGRDGADAGPGASADDTAGSAGSPEDAARPAGGKRRGSRRRRRHGRAR